MSKRPYRFIVYKNELWQSWGWCLQAPNGVVIARNDKDYETKSHAIRSARDVMLALQVRDVVCP